MLGLLVGWLVGRVSVPPIIRAPTEAEERESIRRIELRAPSFPCGSCMRWPEGCRDCPMPRCW